MLLQQLGARGIAITVADLVREVLAGDPFATLPPPWTARERACRNQARPAVWLYRALLRRHTPDRALEVTTQVVAAEGAHFMGQRLTDLDPRAIAAMTPAERGRWASEMLSGFFTAIGFVQEATPTAVRFTVSACALARLVRAAGHPELAGAFCAADDAYFAARGVALHRPTTIARGDDVCRFELSAAASSAPSRSATPAPPDGRS